MNDQIHIKNGTLDLFTSGTCIVNQNLPTYLNLKGESETPIELILLFEDIDNEPKHETKTNFINENSMEIKFINFNNALGVFGTKIWELGTLKNRKLFFYYMVRDLINSEMKEVTYTFYLGEEVKNG